MIYFTFTSLHDDQVDRSGQDCRVVPQKVAKDSQWKDEIYDRCVSRIATRSNADDIQVHYMKRELKGSSLLEPLLVLKINQPANYTQLS